jgi:hypothetical protein
MLFFPFPKHQSDNNMPSEEALSRMKLVQTDSRSRGSASTYLLALRRGLESFNTISICSSPHP